MLPSFKCNSIQKEIPHASCSGVAFVQNAREKNYLMDYNWMYTYFIKARDQSSTIQSAVKALEQWFTYKNLQLNSDKWKELIIDFKRTDASSTL